MQNATQASLLELMNRLADGPWPPDWSKSLWLWSRTLKTYYDAAEAGGFAATICACDIADLSRFGRRSGGWWASETEFVTLDRWLEIVNG